MKCVFIAVFCPSARFTQKPYGKPQIDPLAENRCPIACGLARFSEQSPMPRGAKSEQEYPPRTGVAGRGDFNEYAYVELIGDCLIVEEIRGKQPEFSRLWSKLSDARHSRITEGVKPVFSCRCSWRVLELGHTSCRSRAKPMAWSDNAGVVGDESKICVAIVRPGHCDE